MKTICAFIFLLCVTATCSFHIARIESQVYRWNSSVTRAEHIEDIINKVRDAQEYSSSLLEATRMLANENGILCERDARAVRVVRMFEEENQKLKVSLNESVDRLVAQQQEIEDLYNEKYLLEYKIQSLERALQLLPKEATLTP